MLNKKDKQLVLQIQCAVVFLQSIMVVWLIKSEWSNHAGVVIGIIIYTIITDYMAYRTTLLIVKKIKKHKEIK